MDSMKNKLQPKAVALNTEEMEVLGLLEQKSEKDGAVVVQLASDCCPCSKGQEEMHR